MSKILLMAICFLLLLSLIINLTSVMTGVQFYPKSTLTILRQISQMELPGFKTTIEQFEKFKVYMDKIMEVVNDLDNTTDFDDNGKLDGFEAVANFLSRIVMFLYILCNCLVYGIVAILLIVVDIVNNIIQVVQFIYAFIEGVPAPEGYAPIWERLPDPHKYVIN